MKKLIIFVLILCLSPVFSLADEIDDLRAALEASTYEELIFLNNLLQPCIFEKAVTKGGVMIEPGMYEVGVDIPAGNYYFEGVKGRFPVSISVYPSIDKTHAIDAIQSVHNIGYGSGVQSPKSGKFILQDGWIVEIVQGPAIIQVFTSLF